ncbi:MAG: RNA polymerase factor sigma-54, partial [Pseudomonadota bacterium]
MKQNLQLRISQNLALTPQLQQSIRLLQLSSLELNQELEVILQENPLLELVDGEEGDGDFDDAVLQKNHDNDNLDADGKQALDGDEPDAFNSLDYQEASNSSTQENSESNPQSNEAPQEVSAAEDFSATDFDENFEEYGSASNWDEGGRQNNSDDDDSDYTRQEIVSASLREHLLSQLKLMPLSDRDQTLVLLLIDSINEDGYLEATLAEMAELLPP